MRRRFFVERFEEGRAALEGEAAHHVARVLRAQPGQLYELSDGRAAFLARVERAGRERVEFALVEPVASREPRAAVTLLLAIVKFDRFEWALEKATELGAEAIVPLAAERSEKELIAAASKRAARWRRILLESAQQARRLRVPALAAAARARDAFSAPGKASGAVRVLLSERSGAPPLRAILEPQREARAGAPAERIEAALAIGPEGGWTDAEFAAAAAAGFKEASLGPNILRTETAVVAGLAAVQLYFDAP